MRKILNSISPALALLTAALLCSAPQVGAAALYKWVDEDGTVRYSDQMPADQVRRKHQQLNRQGVVVTTTEAAKSEEELAAEAEARRLEEERRVEEAELKRIQDQKDQVLLLTFSSVEEIRLARDDRIEVIDSVIRLINKSIESTQEKLEKLEAQAEADYVSQGQEVPGGLAQKIEHFTRKIESRNAQLEVKLNEREKIYSQAEQDINRYHLLTSQQD